MPPRATVTSSSIQRAQKLPLVVPDRSLVINTMSTTVLIGMSHAPTHKPYYRSAATRAQKRRPPPCDTVDPFELTQALLAVQAERAAKAERWKRERAEVERRKASNAPRKGDVPEVLRLEPKNQPDKCNAAPLAGPYVPREAASQFARTTTQRNPLDGKLIHRLSQTALKVSLQRDHQHQVQSPTGPNCLNRVSSQRHPRIPEDEESSPITEQQHTSPRQYTFEGELDDWKGGKHPRRSSTGDLGERTTEREEHYRQSLVLLENNPVIEEEDELIDPKLADEHRVDWTQSDEAEAHKPVPPPVVKTKTSIWGLRAKLGHSAKQDGGEVVATPLSPRSLKASFFSRFKH